MVNDPYEKEDVSATYPDKLCEVRKLLEKKLEETGGKLAVKNPNYPNNN